MLSYPFNVAGELCAGAAQAAALCSLVIRGAQRGLTKAVSRAAAAEHALSTALNAVGGRVFPAEDSRTIPRLWDAWRLRTPIRRGESVRAQEVPDPYGGPRPRRSARSFPSLETRGVSGPIPRRGTVRGRWPGEGNAWPMGPGYSVLPVQLWITTRVLPCRSKSGYPCYRVPTVTILHFAQ